MGKSKRGFFGAVAVFLLLFLTACSSSGGGGTTNFTMGTGSQGGTYFGLGNEMANVWNKNIEHINVTATESGASIENLGKIASGDFDLGLTVNLTAYSAMEGAGDFEGKRVENFAFLGHVYPEVMQIVTRESTGIKRISDLKGKRVAIGPPGGTNQTLTKMILAAYGIHDGDYEAFQEGFADARSKLQDGTIDAMFCLLGLPDAGIEELQASVGDVKFLDVGEQALTELEKEGYSSFRIPSNSYEWLQNDVSTVSAFAILVANTDTIDEDTAYQLVKVMLEKADQNTHAQARHMTKENALNGLGNLPLHPGAEKYYKEIGLR